MKRRLSVLLAFIALGRPLFLSGGVLLYALGVAVALYEGVQIHWAVALVGQIGVTAVQLATHYFNDAWDMETDSLVEHPTFWTSGSRVLVQGWFSRQVPLAAAWVLIAVALVSAFVLRAFLHTGSYTLVAYGFCAFVAWAYSAPPLRLIGRGLGEATTALVVAGCVPLLSYYLQTGYVGGRIFLATLPLIGFLFAMTLAIEFPDELADAATGKRTLLVRLGRDWVVRMHTAIVVLAYLAAGGLLLAGFPLAVPAFLALSFPLAVWQIWAVTRHSARPAAWGGIAFRGIALFVTGAVVQLAAFVFSLQQWM
ncbi:MAG: prenyltransferase [Anaerolineae bacterium]|nr:prenyltransferase [Anaerolineae bacterium]